MRVRTTIVSAPESNDHVHMFNVSEKGLCHIEGFITSFQTHLTAKAH